jgi:hypothetical protein
LDILNIDSNKFIYSKKLTPMGGQPEMAISRIAYLLKKEKPFLMNSIRGFGGLGKEGGS